MDYTMCCSIFYWNSVCFLIPSVVLRETIQKFLNIKSDFVVK